ncbi:MAG TPA: winged helix-turn-helix domain-containing protein [Solirubrobacteraceae bacterium]|nr:winged helix-turn-helix domain-containing protein [Solirubrobacteraceae bacterium]
MLCVARDPDVRIREIAECVGIQERAAHRIVAELVKAGYITKHRQGNRGRYEVRADLPMRHPLVRQQRIGEILAVLAQGTRPES